MLNEFVINLDPDGMVSVRDRSGRMKATSRSAEAHLLFEILQRMPDPRTPLAEAVEWETLDGTERTTDKARARNWASVVGVRVVRRATGAAS